MADYREISQEYAKEGFKAVAVINGGAALAILSQASSLSKLGLGGAVGLALGAWCLGLLVSTLAWLAGFASTRHVDRASEPGADQNRAIRSSNRYMTLGIFLFVAALFAFAFGSATIAYALAAEERAGVEDLGE